MDATTGGNALQQAVAFHEAVGLTGITITKLDGTATMELTSNATANGMFRIGVLSMMGATCGLL